MFEKVVLWLFNNLEKYPFLWIFGPIIVLFLSLLSLLACIEFLFCKFLSV